MLQTGIFRGIRLTAGRRYFFFKLKMAIFPKKGTMGQNFNFEKKYLGNGKSPASNNLLVCSTNGYYKLVNLEGYGSLQEEDIFFQTKKIAIIPKTGKMGQIFNFEKKISVKMERALRLKIS